MGVLLVKNLFKGLQWHNFLGMFYGYGRHACSQHHSLQCDGWWLRKAIRIPPAAGTTVMETCKPGSWSLLAGTHAINFHADVGKKHFTLRGIRTLITTWRQEQVYRLHVLKSHLEKGYAYLSVTGSDRSFCWVLNDGDASSTSKWT